MFVPDLSCALRMLAIIIIQRPGHIQIHTLVITPFRMECILTVLGMRLHSTAARNLLPHVTLQMWQEFIALAM